MEDARRQLQGAHRLARDLQSVLRPWHRAGRAPNEVDDGFEAEEGSLGAPLDFLRGILDSYMDGISDRLWPERRALCSLAARSARQPAPPRVERTQRDPLIQPRLFRSWGRRLRALGA